MFSYVFCNSDENISSKVSQAEAPLKTAHGRLDIRGGINKQRGAIRYMHTLVIRNLIVYMGVFSYTNLM